MARTAPGQDLQTPNGPDPDYYSGPCGNYQHYKGYL